ncbi:neurotrophin 1-like [Homarus americanus]|uniref:Neurotrophin 1-like 9 n=1 Tax=Homarus americanus TaxID=6706 RepID=A0A8J5JHI3_HOMAM|nr:neurotrophin 1-like [Homarus americanus]KAG7156356.1 Neurotrophin 1-like 9 [Homarus americanus]
MALRFVVSLAVVAIVLADQSSHVSISHGGGTPAVSHSSSVPHRAAPSPAPPHGHRPSYTPRPTYPPRPSYTPRPTYPTRPTYTPRPTYAPRPSYHPQPSYHPTPAYGQQPSYDAEPACAAASSKPWCLEDNEYPTYEIEKAAGDHSDKLLTLYADVADLDTKLSVERPNNLYEETYLCPSETAYVRPLRAKNTDGKWRIIVNNIKVHYQTLTQTTRIEECLTSGDACPLVPVCYESKCLQKSIYHRFLVYDPYDQYFPFAIETFKLPASCACLLGAYTIDH